MADAGFDRVDAYIDAHLEHYVDELSQLCAQPSVSAQDWGMGECADLVADLLRRHGAEAEQFETGGNPIVVARIGGRSDRTLLFYNHYDVQPAEPFDLWTHPPFEPVVRDGKLFARGARDDKGEIIARIAAVDALADSCGGQLPCSVLFVIEGEEEISSPHIAAFVQDHADMLRCDGAVWEEGGIARDGNPVLPLGVRGILEVELMVRTLSRDAHSGTAHLLPSAAWRLVWALSTLKGPDERIRIPGFYEYALAPSEQDLALLDGLAERNPQFAEQLRRLYGNRGFVAGHDNRDLQRSVFTPTCSIDGMGSGYQGQGSKTIVPSTAMAKLDFRLVPDQDPHEIYGKLRRHLDDQGFQDVEMRMLGWMRPARMDPDDPLVRLTVRTGREVYGGEPSIVPLIGGSSPAYAFAETLGTPVVTAGVGYWDNCDHAPDEHVRIADLRNGIRHIARILAGFGSI